MDTHLFTITGVDGMSAEQQGSAGVSAGTPNPQGDVRVLGEKAAEGDDGENYATTIGTFDGEALTRL